MSKSRGTFITASSYVKHVKNTEYLRYYYASKLNGTMEDIDLSLEDFVAKVNSDLIGKYINIASRCAGFLTKFFEGKLLLPSPDSPEGKNLLDGAAGAGQQIREAFDARDFGKAIRDARLLCTFHLAFAHPAQDDFEGCPGIFRPDARLFLG